MDLLKRQETIVSGCARRGDSFPMCPQKAEHRLSELRRWVRAAAISSDPREGHETLRLLPPRILCASTGHYTPPPWEPVQHATARDNFPRRTQACPGCCNITPASATAGSPCIPIMTTVLLLLPGLRQQESPNQLLL